MSDMHNMNETGDDLIWRALGKDRDALPRQSEVVDPNLMARAQSSSAPTMSGAARGLMHGTVVKGMIAIVSVLSLGTAAYLLWPNGNDGASVQSPSQVSSPRTSLDQTHSTPQPRAVQETSHARHETARQEPNPVQPPSPTDQRVSKAGEAAQHQLIMPKGESKTYENPNASLKISAVDSTEKNRSH